MWQEIKSAPIWGKILLGLGVLLVAVIAAGAALSGEEEDAPAASESAPVYTGDPTDPSEPRELSEMLVLRPENESATVNQLQAQLLTNFEDSDPTHEHEVSCSYLSSFRVYMHYQCIGYTYGGQSGAGAVEVTVHRGTGAVTYEPMPIG